MRSIIIAAAFSCACLPGDSVQDLILSGEAAYPVSNQSAKSARLSIGPDFAAADVFLPSQSLRLASADPDAIVIQVKRPETDALANSGVTFEPVEEPETTASLPPREAIDPQIDKAIDKMIVMPRIPADPDLAPPISKEALCGTLADAAQDNKLPLVFFNNLIWQESRFKLRTVSRAGALGVAQFMPYTAASVGLANPFDAFQALPASARLLKSLREQFGNLGLAAAAYNAGPGRVASWLSKRSRLPAETRNYVKVITGHPAEHWRSRSQTAAYRLPAAAPCREMPTFAQADEEARQQEEVRKAAEAEKARAARETKTASKLARSHRPRTIVRLAAKDQSGLDVNAAEAAPREPAKPAAKTAGKAMSKPVQLAAKVVTSTPVQLVVKKVAAKAQPAAKKLRTASLKK